MLRELTSISFSPSPPLSSSVSIVTEILLYHSEASTPIYSTDTKLRDRPRGRHCKSRNEYHGAMWKLFRYFVPATLSSNPVHPLWPTSVDFRLVSTGVGEGGGGGKGWFERGDKRLKFIRKRRGEGEGRSKLNIFFFFGNIFGEISWNSNSNYIFRNIVSDEEWKISLFFRDI